MPAATAEDRMRPAEPARVQRGHQPLDLLHVGPTVRLTKHHAVPRDAQTIADELFPAIRSNVIEDIERDDRVERCIGLREWSSPIRMAVTRNSSPSNWHVIAQAALKTRTDHGLATFSNNAARARRLAWHIAVIHRRRANESEAARGCRPFDQRPPAGLPPSLREVASLHPCNSDRPIS